MMMFHFHEVLALELIALVSGVALLIMIKNQMKIKAAWLCFIAWFVIVISALSIICSAFHMVTLWNKGFLRMDRFMMERNMMQQDHQNMKGMNR